MSDTRAFSLAAGLFLAMIGMSQAYACQVGDRITISGIIDGEIIYSRRYGFWSFGTKIAAGPHCMIWDVQGKGQPPAGCGKGRRFTASGTRWVAVLSSRMMLDNYRMAGGRIGVCPPCGKTHGITDRNLAPNASWMGAQALLAEMSGRQVLSF